MTTICMPLSACTTRPASSLASLVLSLLLLFAMSGDASAMGMCVVPSTNPGADNPADLPRASIGQFRFKGGFTVPADQFGASNGNYAEAIIEQSGSSLFMVGFVNDDAIAEFTIPPLVNSTNVADLNSTGAPVQQYTRVLNRAPSGNSQSVDQIMGMEVYKGHLIINGDEYYDAAANNTHSTLVLSDAFDIAGSSVEGFLELPGAARSAGWITQLPPEWQDVLNGDLLVGNSAGTAIISRHSVGPSAHSISGDAFLAATTSNPQLSTQRLLEYSLEHPLNDDLYNDSRTNDIWTITSMGKFGFIVPGTSTYAVFGSSSGHVSGLGYKITQNNGNLCGGPCAFDANDEYNYYWLYDMSDLLAVQEGSINAYDVRPYDYGQFNAPFQTGGFNPVVGGSLDLESSTLYLSIKGANNTLGQYDNPPVIAAFDIDLSR